MQLVAQLYSTSSWALLMEQLPYRVASNLWEADEDNLRVVFMSESDVDETTKNIIRDWGGTLNFY